MGEHRHVALQAVGRRAGGHAALDAGLGLGARAARARGVASTGGAGGICTAALAGVWPEPWPSASRSLSGPPTWALMTGASSPSASSAINTTRADPLIRCIGGTLVRSWALRAERGDLPPLHLADQRERPVERGLVVGARAHLGDGAVVGDLDRLHRDARVDDVLQTDLQRLLAGPGSRARSCRAAPAPGPGCTDAGSPSSGSRSGTSRSRRAPAARAGRASSGAGLPPQPASARATRQVRAGRARTGAGYAVARCRVTR